jgi:hypothetical protein
MAQILAFLVGLIVVTTGGALIVMSVANRARNAVQRSPTAALQVGDLWYRDAVHMARLLEQLRRDDMVAVTIPPPLKEQIDEALRQFWDLHTR